MQPAPMVTRRWCRSEAHAQAFTSSKACISMQSRGNADVTGAGIRQQLIPASDIPTGNLQMLSLLQVADSDVSNAPSSSARHFKFALLHVQSYERMMHCVN